MLSVRDIAHLADLPEAVIRQYVSNSRAKLRRLAAAGEPVVLEPADMPVPRQEDYVMATAGARKPVPRWPAEVICGPEGWLAHRVVGGGSRRKAAQP
jgi:hypothetical protein